MTSAQSLAPEHLPKWERVNPDLNLDTGNQSAPGFYWDANFDTFRLKIQQHTTRSLRVKKKKYSYVSMRPIHNHYLPLFIAVKIGCLNTNYFYDHTQLNCFTYVNYLHYLLNQGGQKKLLKLEHRDMTS